MTNLEVPGPGLHYETRGSGPLLLMFPFKALAEHPATLPRPSPRRRSRTVAPRS